MTLRTIDVLSVFPASIRPATLRRLLILSSVFLVAACALEHGVTSPLPASSQGCATCHAGEAASVRSSRLHASSETGCLGCHLPHAGATEGEGPAGLRADCADCHAAEAAQFSLPFRHPLGAGFSCTSCHRPHGEAPREMREHLREDVCTSCHFEYFGPFQYEHEGDRNLGCLSCHLPHGSPNRRLLTHADTRLLCFSCHLDLEDTHLQNPGSIYRQCLSCHTEVHGSNWDRELLK